MSMNVFILGGTADSQELYKSLKHQVPDLEIGYSLAGVTAQSDGKVLLQNKVNPATHIGGFGGAIGLAQHLTAYKVDAVIDATHPFAAQISANAEEACTHLGLPRLRLDRPQWILPPKTDAIFVPDAVEAANLLVRTGAQSAFLTIGRKALGAFEGLDKTHLLVRLLDQPNKPLSLFDHTIVTGRPPFSIDEEEALMREHHIDTLVTKASGGDATRAKLDAAERVRARIILIRRPLPPEGERVFSVEEAVAWVKGLKP